ncbi:DUF998 domain-containing protein [Alkalicoccus saliphilus]|uniref:DUF998 domain-containing protein n=1 Tax=Alkalicoccus saliphilus TaxID=200989 RepID=UPI00135C5DF6|nr:DUF998 domain-containing protein [Alkalicoccus saliphilus]
MKKAASACFLLFLIVSTVLPFFSFQGYSMLTHTTSHLAAQGAPHAWVMKLVFICLGSMAVFVTYATRIRYHQLFGVLFGFSLIMTAFFPHAPMEAGLPVNVVQDKVHSVFAGGTGFSFTVLAVGHAFMSRGNQRTAGVVLAIAATLIPLLMIAFPSWMGLLQRMMFICAFGWLFFYMEPPKQYKF